MPSSLGLAVLVWMLQSVPAPSPAALVDDVRTLTNATTNEARFDAVTALLRARNLPFTVESFTINRAIGAEVRTTGRNIVVSIGDAADEIVIGAHYDAVRLDDGSLSHGAVDNAASSVMLVHVAEALRNERLPNRIRIVWFDMEELGLVGSARYVQAHRSDRIRAMLNFDVNGYGDTVVFGAPSGGDDGRMRRIMLETCAAEQVDCVRMAQMPPGDDRSFGAAQIPALSIAILPGVEAHQLWLMMNSGARSGPPPGSVPAVLTTIHTPGDVVAKVEGAAIARVHRLTVALVRTLTNSLQ